MVNTNQTNGTHQHTGGPTNPPIPSIYDYLTSLGFPGEIAQSLTFEEAKHYTEANQSVKEHYENWIKASSHDHEVDVPLRLYAVDLTPDLFGRLIIQQIGGGSVQADLMGDDPDSMLVESVCMKMKDRGIDVSAFLPGGSHHTGWTERVVQYHDMLATHPFPPYLLTTVPQRHEIEKNPRATFFISDGNHRALAAGIHFYVSEKQFPTMKAIVAWGDRPTLEEKFGIKI